MTEDQLEQETLNCLMSSDTSIYIVSASLE
jgi:hypothetical protein